MHLTRFTSQNSCELVVETSRGGLQGQNDQFLLNLSNYVNFEAVF